MAKGFSVQQLVIANFKGGVGKTTLAVNLAVALSRSFAQRVLLVDTDPSANVTAQLRIHPKKTLYHLLMDEASLQEVLIHAKSLGDLYILPSSRATQAAEIQISTQVGRERILQRRLGSLNGFDTVIFDTPPSISLMSQNALVCARSVLIPLSMDPMSLLGASSTLGLLGEVENGLEVKCSVLGIVPTFVESRRIVTRLVMEAIGSRFSEIPVLPSIRMDAAVRKATAVQTPVVEKFPRSRASQDFIRLAEYLAQAGKGD